MCWDSEVFKNNNKEQYKEQVKKKRNKPSFYYLGKKHHSVYFTQREAECMTAMISEKTNIKIGAKLNLSPRTVEFYLQNMKKKVGCRTKKELLCKVLDSEFFFNFLKQNLLL